MSDTLRDDVVNPIRRLVLLNQMAGPLFRQLAEGLAAHYPDGCLLLTGHPDTLAFSLDPTAGLVIEPAPAYDRQSWLHRALSWGRYLWRSTPFILRARRGDALVLVSNPPLLGPWVWLLSLFHKVPYIVLVYDIHPDVLVRLGALAEQGLLARCWRLINRRVYRRARAVVTIGQRMAGVLRRQVGNKGPVVSVVPPWVDIDVIKPMTRLENPLAASLVPDDATVVLYSGNMGASHDIDSILEAARMLRDVPRIYFLLIGEGEKYVDAVNFVAHHALANIRVLPFQPEDRLPCTLPLGDIALVALDDGLEDLMVPSKVFFYLAAGSAVIAIANDQSELSDLLAQGEVGMRIPPRHPELLAEMIQELVADPGRLADLKRNARQLAESTYAREIGIGNFVNLLTQAGLAPSAHA